MNKKLSDILNETNVNKLVDLFLVLFDKLKTNSINKCKQLISFYKKKKLISIILFIFLLLSIVFITRFSCSSELSNFKFEKISIGEVTKNIQEIGKLEIINPVNIYSPAGNIQKIYADHNDRVVAGQLLLVMDTPDVDKQITQTFDNLQITKMNVVRAEKEYEISKKLYEKKLLSKVDLINSEINVNTLTTTYKYEKLNYDLIATNKDCGKIKSPVSGIIVSRNVDVNSSINGGTFLFLIAPDIKTMRIILNVDESDITFVSAGQDATVAVYAFYEKKFQGKVIQVRSNNPKMIDERIKYEVVIDCYNENEMLKPGMNATVSILVARKENVIRVPNQSFIIAPFGYKHDPAKKYIWIKQDKLLTLRKIKRIQPVIGLAGDQYTEILDKVKIGDEVIVGTK